MINLFSLFFWASAALATTKIQLPSQPIELNCQVRAEFKGVSAERLNFKKGNASQTSDLVFWNLSIIDVSNKEICPVERELALRVRGGSFASGTRENPNITYVVELKEPKRGELFSARIRLLEGRDSFTNRDYKEWTLGGVVSE